MKAAPGSTASDFVVSGKTVAGLLTVQVHGPDMTYRIAPYHYDGLSCASATFPGRVAED